MVVVTCPECGKELTVSDPNREFVFCRHCGTKIEIAAFVKPLPKQPVQKTIITPPPQDSSSEASDSESSVEQLRQQHEIEMEQLRYEHELELERLRHENELERDRMRYNHAEKAERAEPAEAAEPAEEVEYTPPTPKSRKHEKKAKPLSWKLGHFCKKHPIWSIIIVIVLFQMIFGGTSNSSSSSASSRPSVTGVPSQEHDYSSSYNFSSAYTYTSTKGNTYYFLFDLASQKVCFVSSASSDASISTLSGSDFTTGMESVFHYSDGNYHRSFKYRDPLSDTVLTLSESWKGDTPTVVQFEKTDVETAEAALNKKDRLYNAALSN